MKYKEMSLKIFNAVREEFIPKIISSWLIISALRLCVTSKEIDIQLFRETNIVLFALALLVFFAQFTILQKLFPKVGVSQIALIASTTAFSMALCMKQENTYVALACSVVEIIVLIYSYYV
ncbi:MAG: hypothetical protein KBT46_06830, partial [Ruminococcus sp.]|nr:hypothetical protein [Candidatus Copronaster equi]